MNFLSANAELLWSLPIIGGWSILAYISHSPLLGSLHGNLSFGPFQGNKSQAQSHRSRQSQASIKLTSKVNVFRNLGNLPWLPFNKSYYINQSVIWDNNVIIIPKQESMRLHSLFTLQGLREHFDFAHSCYSPLSGFDNKQNHCPIREASATSCRDFYWTAALPMWSQTSL